MILAASYNSTLHFCYNSHMECPNCYVRRWNPALPLATRRPNLDIIWDQAEAVAEADLALPDELWPAIEHAVSFLHVHQIGSYMSGFDPYRGLEPEIFEKKIKDWMRWHGKQFMLPGSEGEILLEQALREHVRYRIPLFDRAREIYDLYPKRLTCAADVPEFEGLVDLVPKAQPEYLYQFPPSMLDEIFRNVAVIELNQGCSVRCNFCSFEAGPKVTNIMPFEDIAWIIDRLHKVGSLTRSDAKIFYYYATDPLDYPYYKEVLLLHRLLARSYPFTSTAYPMGQEELFNSIAERITRLSLSHMNIKRLARDGLITRTPEKGFVPNTPDLREALFFGFLSGSSQGDFSYKQFQEMKHRFKHPDHILTNYLIELFRTPHDFYNLLLPDPKKPWMKLQKTGRYREPDGGITQSLACRDGVLLTSFEARNIVKLHSTADYSKGYIEGVIHFENLFNGDAAAMQATHIEELLPYCIIDNAARYSTVELKHDEHPELNFYTYQHGMLRENTVLINRVTGNLRPL